jgi:AraC-like DNA-binding protein
VGPGDVLIHQPFESHLNRFAQGGAEVVILPLSFDIQLAACGRFDDLDGLARVAERDPRAATSLLMKGFRPRLQSDGDWPDILATVLRADPGISVTSWARSIGLRPETVSRGFRLAYGTSPASYRATARARAAFMAIRSSSESLAALAARVGFADQAHMTRAVVRLTGHSPGQWRANYENRSRFDLSYPL